MNNKELNLMHEFLYFLCEQSRKITVKGFKNPKKINYKLDGTPVTKFDVQAENKIRELITKKFPDHNIFGEESFYTDNSSDYTWLIDPIDGTKSYAIGRPLWGTMIALIYKKKPMLGLVDLPCLKEIWLGDNKSCYFNKKKFKSRKNNQIRISEAIVASTDPSLFKKTNYKKFQSILDKTKYNCWSGDCHNYILLSNGGVDIVIEENLSAYDIFPLIPILKAQGLFITDWVGGEIEFQFNHNQKFQILASVNYRMHTQLIKYLKDH